ncbi:MAG TPA: histidine phosphatase family protein [Candidatus Sulfotelmatobacter sp.]|jgi:broad specificity phosphatase PhoE|nr:histidine phosphatase family protein [Candidatus Sulfotelmatobacter sp.]
MGKIFIVRHGQDEDNAKLILNGRRDTPLTDLGKQQAETVATKLKGYKIDVIYSSPLKRAFETAQIIAHKLGIKEVIPNNDMLERDFGILTGKPIADIPKYATNILPTNRVNYFLEAEGAEDFPTLYKRGEKVLEDIRKKHPDEIVLVVAHGDIGKMICAVYHKWNWEEGLKKPYFDNTSILELTIKTDIVE